MAVSVWHYSTSAQRCLNFRSIRVFLVLKTSSLSLYSFEFTRCEHIFVLSTVWPFRMCFFSQFGGCHAKNVYATSKQLFSRKSTKRSLPSRTKQRQWYHSTRLNERYEPAFIFIIQASMVFCFWKNCATTIFLKNPFTICLFTVR